MANGASPFLPSWRLLPSSSSSKSRPRALILLLLLISGLHPNPGPPSTPLPTLLQWNCNGLRGCAAELLDFLRHHRIAVAALQETKLSDSASLPTFPDYTLVPKNRQGGGGGGVAFLVHHSLPFTNIDTSFVADAAAESQGINVRLNNSDVDIFNVYLPPVSSCPPRHQPEIESLLNHSDGDAFVVGDFNAHHSAWSSSLEDARGRKLASVFANHPYIILNNDTHTRLSPTDNDLHTSPDISLASPHLALATTWTTHITLCSDHLPITIALPTDDPPPGSAKTYTNFRAADVVRFRELSEADFASVPLPTSCSSGEKTFRRLVRRASKRSVPAGRRTNSHQDCLEKRRIWLNRETISEQ